MEVIVGDMGLAETQLFLTRQYAYFFVFTIVKKNVDFSLIHDLIRAHPDKTLTAS